MLNAIMLGVEIDVSAALGQNDVPPAFGASASASGVLHFLVVSYFFRNGFLVVTYLDVSENSGTPKSSF